MGLIAPIILILASVGLFFGYIDPNYKGSTDQTVGDYPSYNIVSLKQELENFREIDANSKNIISKRDELVAKKNRITEDQVGRLEKMVPSNIDNIRLIIEIGKIAQGKGLTIRNVTVGSARSSDSIGQDNSLYGTLPLTFSVNASYNNFLSFLSDLENNLRIIDVSNITFNSSENGQYDFNVSLNTYWLK